MVSVLQTKELPTWAAKCVFLQYFKLLELLNWHTDVPSLCHFLCLKWLIPTVGKGRTGLGKSSFHFQISYPEMSSFPEAFPPVLWVDHASHRGRGGGRTRELASCKMSDLNGSKAWSGLALLAKTTQEPAMTPPRSPKSTTKPRGSRGKQTSKGPKTTKAFLLPDYVCYESEIRGSWGCCHPTNSFCQ